MQHLGVVLGQALHTHNANERCLSALHMDLLHFYSMHVKHLAAPKGLTVALLLCQCTPQSHIGVHICWTECIASTHHPGMQIHDVLGLTEDGKGEQSQ